MSEHPDSLGFNQRLVDVFFASDTSYSLVTGLPTNPARPPTLSPNEFRHSAATLLIEADVPIHQVADVPGHKDTRMLAKHYRHTRGVVDVTDGQGQMFDDGCSTTFRLGRTRTECCCPVRDLR